jgi:hypothetical protein
MLLIPSFVIPLTVDIQNRPTVPHNWVIWYVCVPSLKPRIKVASNSPNPLFLCLLDEYIRFIAGRRICRGQRETGDADTGEEVAWHLPMCSVHLHIISHAMNPSHAFRICTTFQFQRGLQIPKSRGFRTTRAET